MAKRKEEEKPVCRYCGKRHAVGVETEEAYEPHPDEIKFHPDTENDPYWAPDGY